MSTIRRWVGTAGDELKEAIGDEWLLPVISHDFRRSFVTYQLGQHGRDVEIT